MQPDITPKKKRYGLRWMIVGIIFGVLVVVAHEQLYSFAHFMNVDPHSSQMEGVSAPNYTIVVIVGKIVNGLWHVALAPWAFVGYFILALQFILPAVTYGIIGLLIGLIHGKIKYRKLNNDPL